MAAASASNQTYGGAIPPPPGVTPNFIDPHKVTGGVVPVSAVFLTLSTIALGLRLYTKIGVLKMFGKEDAIIIVAWLFNVMSTAVAIIQMNYGNGVHLWDIPLPKFLIYQKWAAVSYLVYPPAVALTKVSILIFYLRINPNRTFRILVWFVLFIVAGYVIAICLAELFACNPIPKLWNALITTGHCIKLEALFLANAYLNVITDFLVLLVPIPMLVMLQVSLRQKLLIWCLVATGSLTCIISAIRISYVTKLLNSPDASYEVPTATALGIVETNLSVVCSSLMVLRPLLRKHFAWLISSGEDTDAEGGRPRRVPYNYLDEPNPGNADSGGRKSGGTSISRPGKRGKKPSEGLTTVDDLEREAKGGWALDVFTAPPTTVTTSRHEYEG